MERVVQTRQLDMQVVEQGEGPLVLLLHGFPELGSTWTPQIEGLAAAGYRAVAPDQRGYGGTVGGEAVEDCNVLNLAADAVALIEALGESEAVVVGHDWGAPVAWTLALLRPDLVRGVVGMSVAAGRRSARPPTEVMRHLLGPDYYMLRFQEPGPAEAELARDVEDTFRRSLYGLSGDAPEGRQWNPASGFLSAMPTPPEALPGWVDPARLERLVSTFRRTGFAGGLNWYRNLDRNWRLMAPFDGMKLRPPAMFIGGDRDPGFAVTQRQLAHLPDYCADLRAIEILSGVGHWIGEERPAEVNALLLRFLSSLFASGPAPGKTAP